MPSDDAKPKVVPLPSAPKLRPGEYPKMNTCVRCGLVAASVVGEPPRCESVFTCAKVEKGESFGGEQWGPSKPAVPELTPKDHEEIAKAIAEHGPAIRKKVEEMRRESQEPPPAESAQASVEAAVKPPLTNGVHQ